MPTVREYEAAMERNAADTEAFVALRKAYRQAQKHDRLVTLYEARAQAIEDNAKAGELFYLAAELRIDQLGDAEGAEADLVERRRPRPVAHPRGRAPEGHLSRAGPHRRLHDDAGDGGGGGRAHARSGPHRRAGSGDEPAVPEPFRASGTRGPQPAAGGRKLAQEHVRSIESARKIYRALGDFRAVVRLYELELEGTQDARRRADLLLGLGRVLGEKLEELDAAAQRLAEVVRLRPRDEKALELLAGVLRQPELDRRGRRRSRGRHLLSSWRGAGRRRATSRTRSRRCARALAAVPGHAESSELLERVYYDARRFQELDRFYRERVRRRPTRPSGSTSSTSAPSCPRASWRTSPRRSASTTRSRCWSRPGGPASEKLVELYLHGQEYAKLAELRERQLGAIADPQQRARTMLELAALYRDRLGDRDQAAVYLHAVLEIEPENQMALGAYAEHFREKGDWAALADLLEFSFERARLAGIGAEELLPRLEEIATVSEKQLGDAERAIAAWQRAEEIAPTYGRAREAQRRLLLKSKSWDRLAALLEREAAAQPDPAQRAEILRRAAQIYREKLGKAARAIEIYKDILKRRPDRRGVDARGRRDLRARGRLRQPGAAAARADRSRRHEAGARRPAAPGAGDLRRADRRPGAGPVGGERDPAGGPGRPRHADAARADPRARRQARRAGAGPRSAHQARREPGREARRSSAASPTSCAARCRIRPGAAERLEEVVRLDPDDGKALGHAGRDLRRRWTGSRIWRASWTCRSSASSPIRRSRPSTCGSWPGWWRASCTISAGRGTPGSSCWTCCPTDAEALDSLARIYNSQADWTTLVRIMERQMPLAEEPGRAADIGAAARPDLRREAARHRRRPRWRWSSWSPRSTRATSVAHERLRSYYEADEDWPRVVKVAERQLFLTEDPALRVPGAMELGALVRDKLGDDKKAITIFERVLEMDADNMDALHAVADLYVKIGDHQRLAFADEKLLEREIRPRRAARADAADRGALRDASGRRGARLRVVPARLPGDARRRGPAAGRSGGRAPRPVRGADPDLRGRARAGERADGAAGGVAEDRAHLRGEAARSGARVRDAVRGAARRSGRAASCCPTWNGWPSRPRTGAGLLDVYARVARARTEAGERVELLRLRAEVRERKMSRSVGRARRDAAQLRAGAREPGDAGRDPAPRARHRALGRGDPRRGPPVRAGGVAAREAGDRAQRRLPGRARGQGSRARVPRLPERVPPGARRLRDRRPPVAAGGEHRQLPRLPRGDRRGGGARPPRAAARRAAPAPRPTTTRTSTSTSTRPTAPTRPRRATGAAAGRTATSVERPGR